VKWLRNIFEEIGRGGCRWIRSVEFATSNPGARWDDAAVLLKEYFGGGQLKELLIETLINEWREFNGGEVMGFHWQSIRSAFKVAEVMRSISTLELGVFDRVRIV
jgi:hypothetical protein